MKEYFVKIVLAHSLQDELNAFCKQGWTIEQMDLFGHEYIVIASKEEI